MPKILLIDDEELVLKSIAKLLHKEGYEVVSCHGGEEAIQKVRGDSFELIVCDVRMPKLSGIETLKQIREVLRSRRQSAPEILITGYADEMTAKEIEALQVADYLYKPFDLRDFLACIKRHIKVRN